MKYYDEMRTKFGFNDGDAQPNGCETYREVYVTALNKLAEKFGSTVRAHAFNRGGLHNSCLIVYFPANAADIKDNVDDCDPDEIMDCCICALRESGIDACMETQVTVNQDAVDQEVEEAEEIVTRELKEIADEKGKA
jgi:hypothetical protein